MCKDNNFRAIRRRQKLSIQDEKEANFLELFPVSALNFD
jgi:hypothetical protein